MTKASRAYASRNAYARSKLTKKQERTINKERKIKMNKKKESILRQNENNTTVTKIWKT